MVNRKINSVLTFHFKIYLRNAIKRLLKKKKKTLNLYLNNKLLKSLIVN